MAEVLEKIGRLRRTGSKIARRVPIGSCDVHGATGRAQSVSDLLTIAEPVVEPHDVATTNITERPQRADFDEQCSLRMASECHPSLKQDIGTCLAGQFALMVTVVLV